MPSDCFEPQLQHSQGDCWGRLQTLHLHAPSSRGDVWVGGALWRRLTALTQLAVTASCYTTLTVEQLPRTLRQVSATAHAIYCDVPILLACPEVDLVARELYLIANTPQNNEDVAAFIWPLAHLARTLAAAGPTRGHTARLCTQVGPAVASRGAGGGGLAPAAAGLHAGRLLPPVAAHTRKLALKLCKFTDNPFSDATPRVQAVWYKWGPTGEPAWLRADQEPAEDPPAGPAGQPAPLPLPPAPQLPAPQPAERSSPLSCLLPLPPPDVLAAFEGSELRQPLPAGLLERREVVADGVLGVERAPARASWPLEDRVDDPGSLPAMLLILRGL